MTCEDRDQSETWLSVNGACAHFGISRSTFYRILNNPDGELRKIVGHLPGSNRLRVPVRAMERLLTRPVRRARSRREESAPPQVAKTAEPITLDAETSSDEQRTG